MQNHNRISGSGKQDEIHKFGRVGKRDINKRTAIPRLQNNQQKHEGGGGGGGEQHLSKVPEQLLYSVNIPSTFFFLSDHGTIILHSHKLWQLKRF